MLVIVGISQTQKSVGCRQRNAHQSHQTGEVKKGEHASSKKTKSSYWDTQRLSQLDICVCSSKERPRSDIKMGDLWHRDNSCRYGSGCSESKKTVQCGGVAKKGTTTLQGWFRCKNLQKETERDHQRFKEILEQSS